MPAPTEGLGVFYLGRPVDPVTGETLPAPTLYDAADLTTHAFIVGMTGSGKTGLGVGIIEEAAIDGIPVIAIDPKGDLADLALQFPDLRPEDFRPWVDAAEAARQGTSPDALAAATAATWRDGLARWDQAPERIGRLMAAADVRVYTPGSSAGLPVSVLGSLTPPTDADPADEAFRDRVTATVGSLLSLVGVSAEVSDGGPVFLAQVVSDAWAAGRALTVPDLIAALLTPPFETLGVMAVDDFFPDRDRRALAMKLNGLVASPGFAGWSQGPPLDADRLFYGTGGRPQVSVMSIAHLGDDERMFFVTRLLAEVVAWMRRQPGTGSLRAILYMDELFGYLPPTANPPSKTLLLTLLKQARAAGLGVVLATQNPVDMDYKALANCGTWFVGRLQTDQDKQRLLDGLMSASGSGDRAALDAMLAAAGKRRFLLHNVHAPAPTLIETRWTLSYLAGPLTRDQIGTLMDPFRDAAPAVATPAPQTAAPAAPSASGGRPDLPGVAQVVLAADRLADVYMPAVLACATVAYRRATPPVDHTAPLVLLAEAEAPVRWDTADALPARPATAEAPNPDATFAPLPASFAGAMARAADDLRAHVRDARPLRLITAPALRATSTPGEDERAFRIRLGQIAREARDAQKDALRTRYEKRLDTLSGKMKTAEAAISRESAQSSQRTMDTVVSIGTSLLGAFLGGRRSAINSVGTAVRSASRARKESGDVARATEALDAIKAEYADLDAELAREMESIDLSLIPETAPLEALTIPAKQADVTVSEFALAWVPYVRDATGALARA